MGSCSACASTGSSRLRRARQIRRAPRRNIRPRCRVIFDVACKSPICDGLPYLAPPRSALDLPRSPEKKTIRQALPHLMAKSDLQRSRDELRAASEICFFRKSPRVPALVMDLVVDPHRSMKDLRIPARRLTGDPMCGNDANRSTWDAAAGLSAMM